MRGMALARAESRLTQVDAAEASVDRVCEEIARAFHDVARFGWCSVMTTDPSTMLPSGGVVEGFSKADCAPFWDTELLDPDFNKFTDLVRRVEPIGTLADAVDGDLERSPRYQKLYRAIRAADELRVAFVAGTTCIGVGVFVRPEEAGTFSPEEVQAVRQLLPLATNTLRRALGRVIHKATSQPPVVLILDANGEVMNISVGGQRVLEELEISLDGGGVRSLEDGTVDGASSQGRRGQRSVVTSEVLKVATLKARWSRSTSSFTTRVRGDSGQWLRLHVSPLEGDAGFVAVTVETARPDDLVPILLDSYGLTDRETEIVLLLCRGLSAREIAGELSISPHTVRDYVKTIYEKADVNSRGELVARLFSNHVMDQFHSVVTHISEVA